MLKISLESEHRARLADCPADNPLSEHCFLLRDVGNKLGT